LLAFQPFSKIFSCCLLLQVMAPLFALIAPRYQFTASHRNGPPVSRDPEALRAKYTDPLVFTGAIRVRTGYEILRLTSFLQQHLHRITVPALVMHGADDMVTDPEGSRALYELSSSADKALRLYDGLLHDLLIEPEKDVVMEDIVAWLRPRV
jgi:acylglycerol lipase